ncbi:hypothetical protein NE237_004249 [Protea cynaroides]|uniref:Mal d 1-associated protein n=1 Tax=Protea cynaroides TaxID=273540 RepID=A0A9Q0KIL5_9MAGN|nr:hypothetical protein NE237_004249 [Protea cynaroides]
MGWEWRDEADDNSSSLGPAGVGDTETSSFRSGDRCSTRRTVKSQCKTEEVEPGKFVRKCEKTEEILKDCIGRPVEVVKSTTEYTEDDVTNEMAKRSFPFESSGTEAFNFPGLRSDIEALERNLFGGLNGFFEAAEEMKKGFFEVFGTPYSNDRESSPSLRRGIPIEGPLEASPRRGNEDSPYADFAGQIRDV